MDNLLVPSSTLCELILPNSQRLRGSHGVLKKSKNNRRSKQAFRIRFARVVLPALSARKSAGLIGGKTTHSLALARLVLVLLRGKIETVCAGR